MRFLVSFLLLFGCVLSTLVYGEPDQVVQGDSHILNNNGTVHAQPWAFGKSSDRQDKIWNKELDSRVVFKNNPQGKMAISDGKRAAREAVRKNRTGVGLSFKDESGSWKVAPGRKDMKADEKMVRDNRHVVSAFANLEATDDLSIRVGPEIILRDDTKGDEGARMDQPDSAFGLGMNFKYDF